MWIKTEKKKKIAVPSERKFMLSHEYFKTLLVPSIHIVLFKYKQYLQLQYHVYRALETCYDC